MRKYQLVSFVVASVMTMLIIGSIFYLLINIVNLDGGNDLERGKVVENKEGMLTVAVACYGKLKQNCIRIDNAFGVRAACVNNVVYFVKTQQPLVNDDGTVKACKIVRVPVSERKTAFVEWTELKPENIIPDNN